MVQYHLWEILTAAAIDLVTGALAGEILMTEDQEDLLKCIRLSATNAEKIVKFLLGQPAVNLFTAAVVLTDRPQEDPKEETLKGLISRIEECLMQYVMSAKKIARFLFSQEKTNQFIAVIVLEPKVAGLTAEIQKLPTPNTKSSLHY